MTFNDIFKSNFLDNIQGVTLLDMGLALAIAFAVGLFIFMVYNKTFSGVMYSSSFGVTLIALTMITTVVILAVTSNVVLSLGMVGALSIVRFRTAIKEPLDIAFLFWSIAAGIVIAAGIIPLALIGSIIIGLILIFFVNRKTHTNPYIIVVECSDSKSEEAVQKLIEENTVKSIIKSKSASQGRVEINMEVRLKDNQTDFINQIAALPGVKNAVLVSYNGDYLG